MTAQRNELSRDAWLIFTVQHMGFSESEDTWEKS